ncbi:MAG: Tim44 domain-containing protein [Deltaproteobacteria bacterium]|nr:Tim44 domain-containing protein [Deltaproteobacteria bacterium]
MFNEISSLKRVTLLGLLFAVLIVMGLSDLADARSSSGGRSFGGGSSSGGFGSSPSRSFGSPSSPSLPPPAPGSGSFGGSGNSFLKGVGGGLVGGMIGNMLFGRSGYGGGSGGGGGGGIGFFELLILGGLGYFIYKRFIKPNMGSRNISPPLNPFSTDNSQSAGFQGPPSAPPIPMPSANGLDLVRQSEPDFNPEKFKEIAQDVFFKVQAAWMRRDTSSVQGLIGQQLKTEYDVQFADLKQKGLINRLENIAVRSIEIVDVGMEGREVYIKVLFTANLLDYTVEESSGKVVKGDSTEPVKFEEFWTFARPSDSTLWKLEGIQVK